MYNCNNNCNKLCPNFIASTSITVETIDGTDTLVINIPEGTYFNGKPYCIFTLQTIPSEATVNMPVAITIGDGTTAYPLVCNKTCLQATASQINTRSRYCTRVQTNNTSGVFRVCSGLRRVNQDVLASLPVIETTGG